MAIFGYISGHEESDELQQMILIFPIEIATTEGGYTPIQRQGIGL